ncbi:hypothetical protein [Streptomyces monomycini]|uniref:hypothetical protein n=1 Tax=Streptomyces monomycini TaxID=371720 RepID=UPI0004A9F693|nr:hypothetical protein [Streptomyces monomycini]
MHAERERDRRGTADRPVRPARDASRAPAAERALVAPGPLTAAQVVGLQQAAGNAAVVQRLAQSGQGRDQHAGCGQGCGHTPQVQRMIRRSGRTHTQREAERIEAENGPRTHARTRAGAAGSSRQQNPLAAAERVPLPRRGEAGQRLWDGSRKHLNWMEGAVNAVLAVTPKRLSSRTGTYRYECGKCGKMVLSKAEARGAAKESNWYEIDHVEGIIANVHRSVDPMNWTVQVGENIYRDVEAISLDDARAAASHPGNLRVLCKKCNGGTRAARSESRYMDGSGARWTGPAYYGPGAEQYEDPSYGAYGGGAEIVTVGPGGGAYGGQSYGGGYGGQSYGGADVVTVEPGGQAYGGESSYGAYGGYGGRQSEDPGYDVVTVEPRRRR